MAEPVTMAFTPVTDAETFSESLELTGETSATEGETDTEADDPDNIFIVDSSKLDPSLTTAIADESMVAEADTIALTSFGTTELPPSLFENSGTAMTPEVTLDMESDSSESIVSSESTVFDALLASGVFEDLTELDALLV